MALKTKYSPLQHLSMSNLINSFGDLSPKNKLVVLGVFVALSILLLFLPLSLFSSRLNRLKKDIANLQKGQSQIMDKIAQYQKVRAEIVSWEGKFSGGEGSLTSRVDAVARDVGINLDQVKEKPSQETDYFEVRSIEVKISNVDLQQVMEFLFELENQAGLRVRKMDLKTRRGNQNIIDVPSLEVATFTLKREV